MKFLGHEVRDTPLSKRIATSLARMKHLESQMRNACPKRQKALWRRIRAIQNRTDVFVKKVTGASWR